MSVLTVNNQQGKKVKTVTLNASVFDKRINTVLMRQAVTTYLSNQRTGLHQSRTRGKVRGGGAKPWRQKGTGRARVGSSRSPLWRGGGVTFGPHPRDYSKHMPQRMKLLALKSALNAKLADDALLIIDSLSIEAAKTKNICAILKNLKLDKQKVTFVVEKIDANAKLACRNLEKVNVHKANDLTTYVALDCTRLVVTLAALEVVQNRIKKWVK